MYYVADFETTTQEEDCRVWAWGISEIESLNFSYGNNIKTFFQWCKREKNPTIYFHNLKFDGSFLISWLMKNDFKWVKEREETKDNTFTSLIDGMGKFYQITVYFKKSKNNTRKITFLNSLNVLNFSVDTIAKSFGLPIVKEKIDYDAFREEGHILTAKEISYLKNDCEIVARALKIMFSQGLNKMTNASNGLSDFKKMYSEKEWNKLFPDLTDIFEKDIKNQYIIDKEIRESYKGGYCYLVEKHRGKLINDTTMIFDVNSLYPSVMRYCPLPWGIPIGFKGKYTQDDNYPLYVQAFSCQFELKPKKLPTIQLKNNRDFVGNEYLSSSGNKDVVLTLTSVDLDLFFEHYDVYDIDWIGGYKFKSKHGIFDKYVDKWTAEKTKAKENHNKGMYQISKLMQNAVYGRMALNPKVKSKRPYLENGILKFEILPTEYRSPLYIPIGTFITSWARYTTITAGQKHYDRCIYFDTDSLHLIGSDMPDLDISDTKLGAWKLEFISHKSLYLRQKAYMTEGYDPYDPDKKVKTKITCAGLPKVATLDYTMGDNNEKIPKIRQNKDGTYNYADFENFAYNSEFKGALKPCQVKDGCILKPINWKIKHLNS